MSARSINKRLMKNKVRSFWGRRAYVPLRIPREFFPVPKPTYEGTVLDGTEHINYVGWSRRHDDGTMSVYRIGETSSGGDPRKREDEDLDPGHTHGHRSQHYLHVHCNYKSEDAEDWSWVEASETRGPVETRDELYLDLPVFDSPTRYAGDEGTEDLLEMADRYVAREKWEQDHLYNAKTWNPEFARLFNEPAYWAKTWYFDEDSDPKYYYVIFSVKWFIRSYRQHFCAGANRLLKYLKKTHPRAKIL